MDRGLGVLLGMLMWDILIGMVLFILAVRGEVGRWLTDWKEVVFILK